MEAVTGQQVDQLWEEKLKAKVDALITRRINLFHDAMIERGQIPAPPPAPDQEEINHCTKGPRT
jgi:hypothetical protein